MRVRNKDCIHVCCNTNAENLNYQFFQTRYWRTWNRLRPTSQSDLCSCPKRPPTPSPVEGTPTRMCQSHLQSLLHPQPRLWTGPSWISRTPITPLSRYVLSYVTMHTSWTNVSPWNHWANGFVIKCLKSKVQESDTAHNNYICYRKM